MFKNLNDNKLAIGKSIKEKSGCPCLSSVHRPQRGCQQQQHHLFGRYNSQEAGHRRSAQERGGLKPLSLPLGEIPGRLSCKDICLTPGVIENLHIGVPEKRVLWNFPFMCIVDNPQLGSPIKMTQNLK